MQHRILFSLWFISFSFVPSLISVIQAESPPMTAKFKAIEKDQENMGRLLFQINGNNFIVYDDDGVATMKTLIFLLKDDLHRFHSGKKEDFKDHKPKNWSDVRDPLITSLERAHKTYKEALSTATSAEKKLFFEKASREILNALTRLNIHLINETTPSYGELFEWIGGWLEKYSNSHQYRIEQSPPPKYSLTNENLNENPVGYLLNQHPLSLHQEEALERPILSEHPYQKKLEEVEVTGATIASPQEANLQTFVEAGKRLGISEEQLEMLLLKNSAPIATPPTPTEIKVAQSPETPPSSSVTPDSTEEISLDPNTNLRFE